MMLRRLSFAAALLVALLSATAAHADDAKDLPTQACENLARLGELIGAAQLGLDDLDACRRDVEGLAQECTNADAVLGCFAALDGTDRDAVGAAFLACAEQCTPMIGKNGEPMQPASRLMTAPPLAVLDACANMVRVIGAGAEDQLEVCHVQLPAMLGSCADRDAALACLAAIDSVDAAEPCIEQHCAAATP